MTTHRGTVPLGEWPELRKKKQLSIRKDWHRHADLMLFLEDHYPSIWNKVQWCRLDYKPKEETSNPGYVKAVPTYVCEQIPFCIQCTKANTQRRVYDNLDKFSMATPPDQSLRLIHIVQGAPIYDWGPDPREGWGVKASQDHRVFGQLVWEALVEHFGEGIGAYMSYQDFGEKGFLKRHPHQDLTLNGWCLDADGKPTLTPYLDLTRGGHEKWMNTIRRLAMDYYGVSEKGTFNIGKPATSVRDYYRIISYQMREMIDFRGKLRYDQKAQVMHTWDYREKTSYSMPIDYFLDGMREYQMRLGTWARTEHFKELHVGYGHLSKKRMRDSQRKFGGDTIPHNDDCPCGECGDWHTVFLDEPGRSYTDVRPLDFEDDP